MYRHANLPLQEFSPGERSRKERRKIRRLKAALRNAIQKGERCEICYDQLSSESACILRCHHTWCENCIVGWTEQQGNATDGTCHCPLCRRAIGSYYMAETRDEGTDILHHPFGESRPWVERAMSLDEDLELEETDNGIIVRDAPAEQVTEAEELRDQFPAYYTRNSYIRSTRRGISRESNHSWNFEQITPSSRMMHLLPSMRSTFFEPVQLNLTNRPLHASPPGISRDATYFETIPSGPNGLPPPPSSPPSPQDMRDSESPFNFSIERAGETNSSPGSMLSRMNSLEHIEPFTSSIMDPILNLQIMSCWRSSSYPSPFEDPGLPLHPPGFVPEPSRSSESSRAFGHSSGLRWPRYPSASRSHRHGSRRRREN
jgi:Ring finger domain